MKSLPLLLAIILFFTTIISGCLTQTQTKTITVTRIITKTETTTPEVISTSREITSVSPTTSPKKDPCLDDSWRDDFEKALACVFDLQRNRNFDPAFSLSLTGNKTKDALIITDFLVNYVYLDTYLENQSMAKGYYYNIKAPYEVFQTRKGTYADMALFAAYALARDGFETYLFYIRTEKGFGVLPGFKIIVDHPWVPREPLVIFWPFRIPMRLSAALKLLEIAGDPPKNITVWEVKYEDGHYKVEKLGTIPASEFQFQATEWMLFGTPEVEVMNELLERDFPGCKFTLNLGALTENAKAIKVEVPYGLLLFSYPFRERYTEILYTVMLSNKTLVKELRECKVLLLAQDASIDLNNPPTNYTAIYSGWVGK